MIRLDACAWPIEHDLQYHDRLPSPYGDKPWCVLAQPADSRRFLRGHDKDEAIQWSSVRKVYFEAFELMWRDANTGVVYYLMDWRQLR